MRRAPDQLASLGLTGLVTAIPVSGFQALVPAPGFKPLAVLAGGLLGSFAASELLVIWVVWRLKRERLHLAKLMRTYEAPFDDFDRHFNQRLRAYAESEASRKVMSSWTTQRDQMRQQEAQLFGQIRIRLSRITDQLSS